MPSLTDHPVWPTSLSRKEGARLKRLLEREGLEFGGLLASVSGTKDLIAWMRGWAYDDEDEYEFEALWTFDFKRQSQSVNQYRLKSLEILDDN